MLLTFEASNDLSALYILDILICHVPSRLLKFLDEALLAIPRSQLATQGDQAFGVRALTFWH